MLRVLMYLIVAAWMGIGIFILYLFWPIFLIGVMLRDFYKGAKK